MFERCFAPYLVFETSLLLLSTCVCWQKKLLVKLRGNVHAACRLKEMPVPVQPVSVARTICDVIGLFLWGMWLNALYNSFFSLTYKLFSFEDPRRHISCITTLVRFSLWVSLLSERGWFTSSISVLVLKLWTLFCTLIFYGTRWGWECLVFLQKS